MQSKTRHQLRRTLDTLETREVPAFLTSAWTSLLAVAPAPAPVSAPVTAVVSAPSPVPEARAQYSSATGSAINAQVVAFAESRMGQRVGGGECAHLAVEALRAAGGKFARITWANPNYVWGTKLTAVVGTANGGVQRVPSARFLPGDVIQFANARFRDGTRFPHHTAIVASVDANGRVTSVYQQNFNGVRAVTKQPLDLSQLVAGRVKVYRPEVRPPVAGRFQFTVVNNTADPVRVVDRAGAYWSSYTLGRADTAYSYQIRKWRTYGGVQPAIKLAGQSIIVTDGAAYEIYRTSSGLAVRRIG